MIVVGVIAVGALAYWYYNKKDGFYPPAPNDAYLNYYMQRPARSRQQIRFTMPSMKYDGTNTEWDIQ
jgi:hypothetical protein